MAKSHFTDGCPIATTLLETVPQAPSIRAAGAKALADWAQIFSLALQAHAVTEVRGATGFNGGRCDRRRPAASPGRRRSAGVA